MRMLIMLCVLLNMERMFLNININDQSIYFTIVLIKKQYWYWQFGSELIESSYKLDNEITTIFIQLVYIYYLRFINFNINFGLKNEMQRKTIKTSLKMTSSKKKMNQINRELLKIYGENKRQRASTKNASKTKKKIKEYEHEHQRNSTQTYQFPEFSMSFLKPENKNIPLSNLIGKRRQPSLEMIEEHTKLRNDRDLKQIEQKDSTDYADLVLALSKVFKNLDIFNRGTINQKNISGSLSAQYNFDFLIKAFHKIRQQKLILTQREFVKHCESFVKESKANEVGGFLKVFINQQTTLKQSININNQSNSTYSPIQTRMALQKGKISQVSRHIKNSNLQKLLESICKKQKKLTYMIQSVKQRKKIANQKNIFKQININHTYCHDYSSNKQKDKENYIKKELQKTVEIKIADFQNNFDLQKQKKASRQDCTPTFAFHIPQNNHRKPHSQNINPSERQKDCNISQLVPNKHNGRWQESTRILNRSQDDLKIDVKSSTMRIQKSHEKCKIDQLNNKLDEYLQRSRSKIEKSKIFLMENSNLML